MNSKTYYENKWCPAATIALIYAIVSVLWISTSDQLIAFFVHEAEIITWLQTVKDWFYVFVTATLLFWLVRRQLAAFHEKENYNRVLFEASPIGLALCRINGELVDANPAFARIIGRSVEETLQLSYWDITPEKYADDEQRQLDSLITNGRYGPYEKEYIHKDGHLVSVRQQGLLLEKDGEQMICSSVEDITHCRQMEQGISNIAAGASVQIGEAFFQSLTQHLSEIFNIEYSFIGLLDEHDVNKVNTVALCVHGEIVDNMSYELMGAPCEHVIRGGDRGSIQSYPCNIQQLFPDDHLLVEMDAQSYVGVPLVGINGKPIGLVVVLDTKPMENTKPIESVLQIFAVRATAELERIQADKKLKISAQGLADAQHMAQVGSWELDLVKNKLKWSDEIYRIFEIDPKKMTASFEVFINAIHPDDREKVNAAYAESVKNKTPYAIDHRLRMPDDTIKYVHENCKTIYDDEGNPLYSIGTVQDITEKKNKDEILNRTQKMDALGKLTGGIAHDFNNMLGVIFGYTELLQNVLDGDNEKLEFVNEILTATERARVLTKKLLAFSRKKAAAAEIADVNKLLLEDRNLLEKTLTVRIDLAYDFEEDLWPILLDTGDFQNAVLNIGINAMHAMSDKGRLTVKTSNVHLSAVDIQNMNIDSGDYVLISITDTGTGMDEETRSKLFDPFFTTKGDKGTGLGMSQVYVFVQQTGGAIYVYSELGHGTRMAIYLPRCCESELKIPQNKQDTDVQAEMGYETILVVDDEIALRKLAKKILSNQNYRVLCAEDGIEALKILGSESVDLMLSDVIMPTMDGYQLAEKVRKLYPDIKIQMVSGFADDLHVNVSNENLHQQRLQKPFTSKMLLQRIRQLLDENK